MTQDQSYVQITREFDAPIDVVWAMWTDPEKFRQWYGPNGMSVSVVEIDLVVGGIRKVCMEMRTPERQMAMWFTGTFTVVDRPTRLAYTESMCDAEGNVIAPSSMGMPEGTPEVTEVTVELAEIDGRTRMTMTHAGVPAGSGGEGGWKQAFDKLEAVLPVSS